MPIQRMSSNSPASTAICGNIETDRMVRSSSDRPRNRTRAKRKGCRDREQQGESHDAVRRYNERIAEIPDEAAAATGRSV